MGRLQNLKKQLCDVSGGIDPQKIKEASREIQRIIKLTETENIGNAKQIDELRGILETIGSNITQLHDRINAIERTLEGGKPGN